jgi:hypothetical protein
MRLLFAVTMCFVIGGVLFVAGCGAPDSGGFEAKESKPAPEKTAPEAMEAPESPVVGESMDAEDFEFRVLDVTRDQRWFYPETEDGYGSQAESFAGEFVTVWYSVRNTGVQPMSLRPGANLETDSGETFSRSETATCDELKRLQPRALELGCFVFDVPEDAAPESVWVRFNRGNLAPETFNLTEARLEDVSPEETLAMYWEYLNVGYFDLAYDQFASESKAQFTSEQFQTAMTTGTSEQWRRYPISDYAFPSVEIEGDRATVERVMMTYDNKNYESSQQRKTQEFVKEDGAWRIIARPDQVEYFTRI